MEGLSVFHALDSTTRRLIVQKVEYRLSPQSTILCHEGDPADACYIILDGKVSIHRLPDKEIVKRRKNIEFLDNAIKSIEEDQFWIEFQDRCKGRNYWHQRRSSAYNMFLCDQMEKGATQLESMVEARRPIIENHAQRKFIQSTARRSVRRSFSSPALPSHLYDTTSSPQQAQHQQEVINH